MNFDFSSIKSNSSKSEIPGFFDEVVEYLPKIFNIIIKNYSLQNKKLIINIESSNKVENRQIINFRHDLKIMSLKSTVESFLRLEDLNFIQTIQFFNDYGECFPLFTSSAFLDIFTGFKNSIVDLRRCFDKTISSFLFLDSSERNHEFSKITNLGISKYPSFAFFRLRNLIYRYPSRNDLYFPAKVNYFYDIEKTFYELLDRLKFVNTIEGFTESVYLDTDYYLDIRSAIISFIGKKMKLFLIPRSIDSNNIEEEIDILKKSITLSKVRNSDLHVYIIYKNLGRSKGFELLDPEVQQLFNPTKTYVIDNNEL